MNNSTAGPSALPLLLVSVGSDHHPFPRLVRWVDDYLRNRDSGPLQYVCQYGTASAPQSGEAHPFIEFDRLQELMGQATAIVVQGGPYSMLESLRNGRIPIAVPRRRQLGEHVDDHQFAFCSLLADRSEIVMATKEDELHEALDQAFAHPDRFVAPPAPYQETREATVRRFASIVSECRPSRRAGLLSTWRSSQ